MGGGGGDMNVLLVMILTFNVFIMSIIIIDGLILNSNQAGHMTQTTATVCVTYLSVHISMWSVFHLLSLPSVR